MTGSIPTALVDYSGRLRDADPAKVKAIAASIKEVGLLNPITVYSRPILRAGQDVDGFGLIAGMHRLRACQSLGWTEIPAVIVDLGEQERIIAECDENLCGSNLSPAEVAMFTAKRKAAYLALHPETANGTNQHSRVRQVGEGSSTAPRFTEATAAATGASERDIQRNASRGEHIDSNVLSIVKGTKLDTGVYLDKLKKVPLSKQAARVREDLAQPEPVKSDAEVIAAQVADMVKRWNKMSPEARRQFLDAVDVPIMDRAFA